MCPRIAGATCFSSRGSVLSIGYCSSSYMTSLWIGCAPRAERREVVAHHTGLQGRLVAVQRRAPGVVGIGRRPEAAMLPDDVHVVELEHGRLRIRDVVLPALEHPQTAEGGDPLRPAQPHEPANHVEHVDSHVADGAVAVRHELAPVAAGSPGCIPSSARARPTHSNRACPGPAPAAASTAGRRRTSRSRHARSCPAFLPSRSRAPRSGEQYEN